MHNFTLYIKSITLVVIISLVTTFSLNAEPSKDEEKAGFSLVIEIPSENIKKIPILGYKLIYTISHASLVDFLDKQIETFTTNINAIAIKPKNIVVIFTNYDGYKHVVSDPNYPVKVNNIPESVLKNYVTNEGIALNLTALGNKYSLAFLINKRYVLIGTLVDDNNLFNGNANLKVAEFNFPDATGFTFHKVSNLTEDNDTKKNNNSLYNYEELVSQRASMIQYTNLGIFKNTSFVGVMEFKDLTNKSYSYFALPGNLNNILYPNNKDKSTPGVK